MCIPQIGLDEHGLEILRTSDEQVIFNACLPNMGLLYSMFPVLVLDDVNEDSHPYNDSGWCFCELSIAALGGQLEPLSPEFSTSFSSLRRSKLGASSADTFEK